MGKEQDVRAMAGEVRLLRDRVSQLEEALAARNNQDEYRALVESAGEAICTMDERGTYLFMNSVAAQRLGGTPQDFVGKTMWDVFPKEIADRQAQTVREVIRSREGTMVESVTVVGGRQRWYRTSIEPVREASGNVASALILARDITVYKQAEQALQISETLYRTTIDALTDAVHVVNRDLRITLFNAHFSNWCRDLGLANNATERTVFEQFPFLPKRVETEYRKVFEQGEPLTTEDEITVGEKEFVTETRKIPVLERGRAVRVVTVVRDVTKLRRAERVLQATHLQLVNAREDERKYLAGELHDSVGQRLVALQLAVQKAISVTEVDAKAATGLAVAAETCADLVQEIRDICHGLYPPTLESLGLASSLTQLGRHCAPNVRFESDFSEDVADVRFGPEREIALFRIAQEAVNNALRHGGARTVGFRLRVKGRWLCLTITDDGCGFDAGEPSDHGLGLHTMRDRAQAVGGRLTVSSRAGRTTIRAMVPFHDRAERPNAG